MPSDRIIVGRGLAGATACERARRAGRRVTFVHPSSPWFVDRSEWDWQHPEVLRRATRAWLTLPASRSWADFAKLLSRVSESTAQELLESAAIRDVRRLSGSVMLLDAQRLAVNSADQTVLVEGQEIRVAMGTRPRLWGETAPEDGPVLSLFDLMTLPRLPESLIVIGCGDVGFNLALSLAVQGVRVTVVDRNPTVFTGAARQVVARLMNEAAGMGVTFRLGFAVLRVRSRASGVAAELDDGSTIRAEASLATIGRVMIREGLNLSASGMQVWPAGSLDDGLLLRTGACTADVPMVYPAARQRSRVTRSAGRLPERTATSQQFRIFSGAQDDG